MKARHSILSGVVSSLLTVALVLTLLGGDRPVVAQAPLSLTVTPSAQAPGSADGGGPGVQPGGVAAPGPLIPDAPDSPDSPTNPNLSFSYYKVIGSAFQPRESTSTYAYTSNGCIYQNAGTIMRFQAPLVIPENSEIKYVRIYYLDTAATDMTVWLTRYEPGQANLDLVSVKSSDSGGYGTVLSSLITQTVDMATYAYVLTWGTSVNSSANQLCGIRIAYYLPTSG
jgi:hypothetical protein